MSELSELAVYAMNENTKWWNVISSGYQGFMHELIEQIRIQKKINDDRKSNLKKLPFLFLNFVLKKIKINEINVYST